MRAYAIRYERGFHWKTSLPTSHKNISFIKIIFNLYAQTAVTWTWTPTVESASALLEHYSYPRSYVFITSPRIQRVLHSLLLLLWPPPGTEWPWSPGVRAARPAPSAPSPAGRHRPRAPPAALPRRFTSNRITVIYGHPQVGLSPGTWRAETLEEGSPTSLQVL